MQTEINIFQPQLPPSSCQESEVLYAHQTLSTCPCIVRRMAYDRNQCSSTIGGTYEWLMVPAQGRLRNLPRANTCRRPRSLVEIGEESKIMACVEITWSTTTSQTWGSEALPSLLYDLGNVLQPMARDVCRASRWLVVLKADGCFITLPIKSPCCINCMKLRDQFVGVAMIIAIAHCCLYFAPARLH